MDLSLKKLSNIPILYNTTNVTIINAIILPIVNTTINPFLTF